MMNHSIVLGSLLVITGSLFSPDELALRLKNDTSLVAPGLGSEGVVLGENVSSLVRDRGRADRVAMPGGVRDLLRDVFGQTSGPAIRFDRVYHYAYGRFAVFLLGDEVVAVAGYDRSRVTTDAVSISAGAESFVFNYGNEGLERLTRRKNVMYVYRNLGIAVADDGGDDSIDLVIVFTAVKAPVPGRARPR
ncbi:MAG TPA: hypothetical protein VLM75_04065 [Spirochaetota bacterium]|nr:hypothetical protein [Spirochaetota bacterium]